MVAPHSVSQNIHSRSLFKMGRFLLLILSVAALGVDQIAAQCNYQQSMVPGQTYQLFSPGYGNNYAAGLSCSWLASAPIGYSITLTCRDFSVPCTDSFVVNKYGQTSGSGDQPYCGYGTFVTSSSDNSLAVRVTTRSNTGRFYCELSTQVDSCKCGRRLVSCFVLSAHVPTAEISICSPRGSSAAQWHK